MMRAPIYATQALVLSASLASIARFFKFRTVGELSNTLLKTDITVAKGLEYARVGVLNYMNNNDLTSIVIQYLTPQSWDYSEKIMFDYFFDTTRPDVERNHHGVTALKNVVESPLDSIFAVSVDNVLRKHFMEVYYAIESYVPSADPVLVLLHQRELSRKDSIELFVPEARDNVAIAQQAVANIQHFKSLLGKLVITASAKLYVLDKAIKAGGFYMTAANVSEAVTKFTEDFGKIDENGFVVPQIQHGMCDTITSEPIKMACVESTNFMLAMPKVVDSLLFHMSVAVAGQTEQPQSSEGADEL